MYSQKNFNTLLFDIKTSNIKQEKYVHIVRDLWSDWLQTMGSAKYNNSYNVLKDTPYGYNALFYPGRRGIVLIFRTVLCRITV